MIEEAVVVYLNTVTAITTALGGQKVYYNSADPDPATGKPVKMPYVIVSNAGGSRKRESVYVTEPRDTLDIDVYSADKIKGKRLADTVLLALENYRGDMPPERDTHFTCGSIRDLTAWQAGYRFNFATYVRYRQATVFPRP